MRIIFILFSFTFCFSTTFSQYKIGVSEKSVGFESGNHNAFTVIVYECSSKDVEKHWKKEMKDMKANVSSKKNEMKGDDAKIKDMGENTFDIYAITNETDNGIELSVAYDLGGAFLSSGQHAEQSKIIKDLMYDFAVKSTKEGIRGILIGLISSPAQKIASVLQAPGGQLARLMNSRSEELGKSN